ncbi:Protein N-terminal asparagine amidohydrolase [Trinorchestia longiramus]|nr:Protein N-terminal asparagine amidohydrolase [Trinorchestia longiramus]
MKRPMSMTCAVRGSEDPLGAQRKVASASLYGHPLCVSLLQDTCNPAFLSEMVLIIDNTKIKYCPRSTNNLFQDHPELACRAQTWHSEGPKRVPDVGMLYVAQREFAVVPGSDERVKTVGSDDATTCHIIVFLHKASGGVAVSHFDGSRNEEHSIAKFTQKLIGESESKSIDVYAIGGFFTKKLSAKGLEESQKLSLKLLKSFINLDYTFNLVQWCCCEMNTIFLEQTSVVRPLFNGLCYDRVTKTAHPALFDSHGPIVTLRAAAAWASPLSCMLDLYNFKHHSITIQPFLNNSGHHWDFYKTLTDDVILQHFSTSPSAEPPLFCTQMRYLFNLLADNPQPMKTLFIDGKPIVYMLHQDGHWRLQ